jgi:signal transduction histidine kinase
LEENTMNGSQGQVLRGQAHVPPPQLPNRRQPGRRNDDRKLLQRERELQAACRISQVLFQSSNVDELVEKVLQTALDVVGADAGTVLLAAPEEKQLVFRYVIGGKAEVLHGQAIPWDKGIAGAVFQSGEPVVLSDVAQDSRHHTDVDASSGYRTSDMITLPLKRWEGDPIGVLQVLNKREGRLDQDDVAILTIVSAFSAQAIEQARLFEEAKLAEVVRLLGDIGHDVKNMLSPIVMGAGIMHGELNELFQSTPALQENQAAQTCQETCNDVIGMQRKGAHRIQDRMKEFADCVKGLSAPPNFAPCCVADVVASVLETLRLVAEGNDITITLEGLDTLPSCQADERRLYNAFYNLINNAFPEVPRGGSITIKGTTDSDAQVVHLAVVDTGRGMPPHVRERLFTKRAISTKAGGTGLGTKIIKDVVDVHGGKITVDSEEGKGTTFHIMLPIQQSGCNVPVKG